MVAVASMTVGGSVSVDVAVIVAIITVLPLSQRRLSMAVDGEIQRSCKEKTGGQVLAGYVFEGSMKEVRG